MAHVSLDEGTIAAFCRKHHIRRLPLLGSTLHGDSIAGSDLHVPVQFEPDHVPGLAFFAVEIELSKLLNRRGDPSIPGSLSPYVRDQVLAEAEVHYAQAKLEPSPPPHA